MKVFSLHILSLLIFAASFQSSLLLLDYEVNRRFYELHCINQDRPQLECHGKCELTKESEKGSSLFKSVQIGFEFHILQPGELESKPPLVAHFSPLANFKFPELHFSQPPLCVLTAPPEY